MEAKSEQWMFASQRCAWIPSNCKHAARSVGGAAGSMKVAGMARRTFMRAFSARAGMSFGRWRQQARLFAARETLAQKKSVTEVEIAVGYDSVSAFIEMFKTMRGTTPQQYYRGRPS